MNNNFKVLIFFFILCLLPLKLPAQYPSPFDDSNVTISMDFQDANLKDVIKIFSIQSGMNFIASEAVQDRKITLFLDKVPVQEAMDKLFKANNLSYELDSESNIFIVKDWGKPEIGTITKIFHLKYATVSSSSLIAEVSSQMSSAGTTSSGGSGKDIGITKAVEKNLSIAGSVIEDYRTNSLIVTDIPSRMPVIEKLIASLDMPTPQVMLEVEMLDVSKNVVDSMGFNFDTNPITLLMPNASILQKYGTRLFVGNPTYRGADTVNATNKGVVNWGNFYAAVLDFLRTQTDTKTLARPRLLTLNNETAEIKIETDEVTGRKREGTAEEGYTYEAATAKTGISLRITPQINLEAGEITMFVYPSLKEASDSTIVDELNQPYKNVEERGTKSLVKVKDGETVIVGGLIRKEFARTNIKIPILGDIPILGALFRHKDKTKDKERELLVFITPHIIKDTSLGLVSAKKVKLPIREQGAGSVLDRQMAISSTLNTFERTK